MPGRARGETRSDESQSVVFRPSDSHEARQTLGFLLAITLMMGVGVPVALLLAFDLFQWWLVILLAVVTVLPFLISLTLIKRMRYEIGPTGITVHHLGAKLYRWDEIHRVEVWGKRLPHFYRVGVGSNMPGYNVGRFRSRDLGDVQMYATKLAPPLVVLKTRTLPVVLSPKDVEEFVTAVRRHSGRADIVDAQ